MRSKLHDKHCNYCSTVGVMPTFADGETMCDSCLKSLPINGREARKEIVRLRAELATAKAAGMREAATIAQLHSPTASNAILLRITELEDEHGII